MNCCRMVLGWRPSTIPEFGDGGGVKMKSNRAAPESAEFGGGKSEECHGQIGKGRWMA